MLAFYDFEVFLKLWTVTIILPIEKEKYQFVNDENGLKDFYGSHKNFIWIGYNNVGYDQYILKSILLGMDPKKVNDFIIIEKRKGWEYSREFNKIPLLSYDCMIKDRSLKQLEGFMGNDIRETTIPFDYDGEFTQEMINEVLFYNNHDVEQTIEVFIQNKNEFNAKMQLIKEFNLPLTYIAKTPAQLGAIILEAKKVKYDDEWNLRLPETLEVHKYKHIADWFMNPENHSYDKQLVTKVCGVEHTFGWGGLHAAIPKITVDDSNNTLLILPDFAQLYPTIMLKYKLLSRAVNNYEKYEHILEESLRLKALGLSEKREPYKRVCNIVYGASGDKYNAMYDPLHRNLVCVYGQVLVVMLLEMLEERIPGFELIQTNTDGILLKIPEAYFDLLDDTIYEFEQKTYLKMDFEYYSKVIQANVNNYIGIKTNGKLKQKGNVKKSTPLDNDLPIVTEAVVEYLVNNTPVEKTIYECDELIKFQNIVKVSSKYEHALYGCTFKKVKVENGISKKTGRPLHKTIEVYNNDGKKLNERVFRLFASKNKKDGGLFKYKNDNKKPERFDDTSDHCFIYNESVIDMKCPDYIDKDFYVKLAKKRLQYYGR